MSLNEPNLEKRFNSVSVSAGSIQSLSSLCLHYKNHHKRIAQIWLRCLQKAKVPHRLTLIYLANDIVQNAKRKNSLSFIEDFKLILKDTVPYLRDEKIRKSVERVFSIWQDRAIFDSKFTTELKKYLNDTGRPAPMVAPPPPRPVTSTESKKLEPISHQSDHLNPSKNLTECLTRLSNIEQNVDTLKSASDSIVDKLAQGPLTQNDINNVKLMEDLKFYITAKKCEVDERNKLAGLLEECMATQKRLLKESENQLTSYQEQFKQVIKQREELG